MIKCYYELVTDQDSAIIKYHTNDLLRNIENISLIEGPNDCGKSTLLHIIALSCYGLQFGEDKIEKGLLSKMNWLLKSSTRTNIGFELEMSLTKDFVFKAKKRLNAESIERTLNNKSLTFERFREKFDLIYDIPTNPTERLREIIESTKKNIMEYQRIIHYHFQNTIDIKNAIDEDPQKRFDQLTKRIERHDIKIKGLNDVLDELTKKEKYLKHYILLVEQKHLKSLIVENRNKLRKIKSRIGLHQSVNKTKSSLHNKLRNFSTNIRVISKRFIQHVQDLPVDDIDINAKLAFLRKLDILNDVIENRGELFLDATLAIKEKIMDIDENIIKEDVIQNVEFLKELKSFLEKIPDSLTQEGLITPVKILKKEIEKYIQHHSDLELKKAFEKVYELHDRIMDLVNEGETLYKTYKSLSEEEQEKFNIYGAKTQSEEIEQLIDNFERNLKSINAEIITYNLDQIPDVDSYLTMIKELYPEIFKMDLPQLKGAYNELVDKIKITRKNISELKSRKKVNELELEKVKNKKKSNYTEHKQLVDKVIKTFQELLKYFETTFPMYIDNILQRRAASTNEERKFREDLHQFLANKIPVIPIKIDDEVSNFKVARIDIVKRLFVTEDGRIVEFASYGSGRTSSLSLISRISALDPKKISILLLDEALMDDVSLGPVKELIGRLYKNGRLLAGILVRYSNDLRVKSLLPT